MSYQQQRKPGNGRVWPQTKSQNPKAPKFTGELKTPDGTTWRISLWEAQNKQTGQFDGFSIKSEAPQQQQNPAQGYQPQQNHQAPPGYQPQQAPVQQAPQAQAGDPGAQSPDDYGAPQY